ncbi:DNA-binding domain-containing protein [Dyella acidiphila]|nr:DNA-binding domain-containing protein [Dyella acidiphila]
MLAQMQQNFQDWLVHAGNDTPSLLGLHATRGLAAYQNNYRTQLVNCLRASYPQLLAWMGEEAFLAVAIAHIDSHPPSAWTLDAYGADFGDSLRTLYPHNPDLRELAWIEWALSDAFVAADAATMALAQLAEVDWDAAHLQLAPSLRQHTLTTNAAVIWSALVDGVAPPEAQMLEVPAGVIVWRREFTSRLMQVDAIEHAALLALRDDDRFDALCAALVEELGEQDGVARAGALLANWIGAGLVVGVSAVG